MFIIYIKEEKTWTANLMESNDKPLHYLYQECMASYKT